MKRSMFIDALSVADGCIGDERSGNCSFCRYCENRELSFLLLDKLRMDQAAVTLKFLRLNGFRLHLKIF
jgi:hypothetical protein